MKFRSSLVEESAAKEAAAEECLKEKSFLPLVNVIVSIHVRIM